MRGRRLIFWSVRIAPEPIEGGELARAKRVPRRWCGEWRRERSAGSEVYGRQKCERLALWTRKSGGKMRTGRAGHARRARRDGGAVRLCAVAETRPSRRCSRGPARPLARAVCDIPPFVSPPLDAPARRSRSATRPAFRLASIPRLTSNTLASHHCTAPFFDGMQDKQRPWRAKGPKVGAAFPWLRM